MNSFGGIFCINLLKRDDRRRQVLKDLSDFPLELVPAVDPSEIIDSRREYSPPVRACIESHIKTLQLYLERNTEKPALVFEDDAFPKVDKIVSEVASTMVFAPKKWTLILLGYGPLVSVKPINHRVGFPLGSDGSHAYLISKLGAKRLLPLLDSTREPFDVQLHKLLGKSLLATTRVLFGQRAGFSDIQLIEKVEY